MPEEMDLADLTDPPPGGTDATGPRSSRDLEAVYDIPVTVSAVLGKATMQVSQLLKLGRGAVVELAYRSAPLEVGLVLAAIGVAASLALLAAGWRRRGQPISEPSPRS